MADDGKRWKELGVIQSGRFPKTGRYINAVGWRLFLSREDRMLAAWLLGCVSYMQNLLQMDD